MRRGFSRRSFLRGASGAALALPLLNDIPRAHAQMATPFPKRLITVFTPNGTIPSAWAATGSGASFMPGTIQKPFVTAGHQNDILVIQNVDAGSANEGPGDAQGRGIGCLLTGVSLQVGSQFLAGCGIPGQFCGSSGWPGGMSVDQFIANRVGKTTQFTSLDIAVKRMSGSIWSRVSYSATNVPVTPMDDPGVAFDRLFANVGSSTTALTAQATRRKSILDAISPRYSALAARLSAADKDKVNTHLTALRDIEMRLMNLQPGGTAGGACAKPTRPVLPASAEVMINSSGMEVQNAANDVDVPMRNQLVRDLVVPALACDLSRVATIMLAPSRSDIFFNFLGINSSHHELSHRPDSDGSAQTNLVQINTWYATQVASLITALKGVKEGSGTMFDNTIVFWCNELGVGNNHSHTKLPLLIAAGKSTGYFKTGQAVNMPAGTPHNRVLLSLIHSMGMTDVTSFGTPKFCTAGPIKELMA